jgi:hypothetical protein
MVRNLGADLLWLAKPKESGIPDPADRELQVVAPGHAVAMEIHGS